MPLEVQGQQDGNYVSARNGQISFNHIRMLTLWEPRRRASSENVLSEIPTIDAALFNHDTAYPGDYSLSGRSRSSLRSVVHETRAWPDVSRSSLEYGIVWAPNGTKINLLGSQFIRKYQFDSITAVVRFDVRWDSPVPVNGDRYAQVFEFLDKDAQSLGGIGRMQVSGDAWAKGSERGAAPTPLSAISGGLMRVWYRAAQSGMPGSGAMRVETWSPMGQLWEPVVDRTHSDARLVSRLNVGLQASHVAGADAGAVTACVPFFIWDTDHSADGPADLVYDTDRAVVLALGDSTGVDGDVETRVRGYMPLGEFDHVATEAELSLVAGLQPDIADGVIQPGSSVLLAGGSPEYVAGLSITVVDDTGVMRPIQYDERVYWHGRVTLGGEVSAIVDIPTISSFLTPPDPDGHPRVFRIGFTSCHTSSGDAHPLLGYRLFRERDCRFVLRLGDNGYNDSQIFDRYSDVTGPWAAESVEDLLTALLPTYLDVELCKTARSIPMWDQGDDHDYVVNNWHAGFVDAERWAKAAYPVNSSRQRIEFVGEQPAFKSFLRGAISNRAAHYIGMAPDNSSVVGFVSLTGQGFTNGENVLNSNGNVIGTVTGAWVPHGWPSPGAALFSISAEELVRRGFEMWNAWQGGGFMRLGAVEHGAFIDDADAVEQGHYYRSFETARTLVLMIDNRRFQEPVRADEDENDDRAFLGEEQLTWLEAKLMETDKPLVVVGSTGVVGDVHSDSDNWFALPSWRAELYRIGQAADLNPAIKRVVFLVGDRHSSFAHTSRLQVDGDPDPGLWTLGTFKGIEFDAGPAAMGVLRDNANHDVNYQYRFEQVPRGPVEGETPGWDDLIPPAAAPLDPMYIIDGDEDEIIHFSTLLAKYTDQQGASAPKFSQMVGTVEIDEINETFTFRVWDTEGDLVEPVVGLADENNADPYGVGRLLWSRTFPFERFALPCHADINFDRTVDSADLAHLLAGWGSAGPADLDGLGEVDSGDLALLLAAWGACPG